MCYLLSDSSHTIFKAANKIHTVKQTIYYCSSLLFQQTGNALIQVM